MKKEFFFYFPVFNTEFHWKTESGSWIARKCILGSLWAISQNRSQRNTLLPPFHEFAELWAWITWERVKIRLCGFQQIKDRPQLHVHVFHFIFPSRSLFWSENGLKDFHYSFDVTRVYSYFVLNLERQITEFYKKCEDKCPLGC